jgi:hypothetical protein
VLLVDEFSNRYRSIGGECLLELAERDRRSKAPLSTALRNEVADDADKIDPGEPFSASATEMLDHRHY